MKKEFQLIDDRITAVTQGFAEHDLLQHPAGKWCAAEILEHLALSYSGTTRGAGRVLAEGKPLATAPSLKQRLFRFVVIGLGVIPGGRQAPKAVIPSGKLGGLEALSRIRAELTTMDTILSQCEERFGASVPLMDHPILGPLNLSQWRRFHLLHGFHHLKQVEERCVPGSPRH